MRSAAKSPQAQTQITLSGAIEGEITTLDKAHFGDMKESPGMTLLVILDEQKSGEAKNTDVAIRVKGCGDNASCQFALTHVYWS